MSNTKHSLPYAITLLNGSKAIGEELGSISLHPNLNVDSLLLILQLRCNLLSLALA